MVLERETFRREHNTSQIVGVNCAPQSEVVLAGTPKLKILPERETRGIASGQCEVLLMMVNR